MKITCESCSAKYTIADDKVRGRKVKIRCKGCGTPIVVDGQASGPTNGEASAEGDSAVVDAPASMAPEAEWSVNLSDTEQVSLSTSQIIEGYRAGRVTNDAFVWKDGMGDWVPLLECAELAPLLAPPPPVDPAAAGPAEATPSASLPPETKSVRPAARAIKPSGAAARATGGTAARVTGGRAQGTHDLFAGVERAGADEEEVATSAPVLPQPGSTKYEEKATGARNENSVLFSLDALKAGFSGGKSEPAPPKTKSEPVRATEDPFGMGSAPAVAGLGGGNSLFSLAANQALLTAPAPPEPRVAPAAVPGSVGAPAPAPPQKKLILFVGLAVGLLAVGLALGVGLSGGKDEKSPAAALDDKSGEKTKEDAKSSETKPEEPKEEPKKDPPPKEEEPKPAEDTKKDGEVKDSTAAPAEKSDTKAPEPPKTGPALTPSKPKEPKEEPKPPADVQPFSKGAAVAALSAASSQAASCKKIGGPTGTGKVQVTFAPSGRVTTANVSGGPFAGTSVGGCVASVFRRAKVPPFSGTQITVSKSFTIR
jgi:predicted Zn finger-like uncharacterized protein